MDCRRIHIRFQGCGARHHVRQGVVLQDLEQAAAVAGAEIDHTLGRRHPPAGFTVCGEREKAHGGVLYGVLYKLTS